MKKFACGDVVPGCDATFTGSSDDEILAQVGVHARDAHGISEVPPSLVDDVVGSIRPIG